MDFHKLTEIGKNCEYILGICKSAEYDPQKNRSQMTKTVRSAEKLISVCGEVGIDASVICEITQTENITEKYAYIKTLIYSFMGYLDDTLSHDEMNAVRCGKYYTELFQGIRHKFRYEKITDIFSKLCLYISLSSENIGYSPKCLADITMLLKNERTYRKNQDNIISVLSELFE